MNERNARILAPLVDQARFYDKQGELKRYSLLQAYQNQRESEWIDQVFWPTYFRATRLMRLFGWPADHFEWLEEAPGLAGWQLLCSDCDDVLHDRFLTARFEEIWYSPEWCFESPTQEELAAMRKKLVPDRENEPSLF